MFAWVWRRLRGQQPLLSGSLFEYENRPKRDALWGYLYCLCLALTLTGGAVAIANRNPAFNFLDRQDFMNDPANCPVHHRNGSSLAGHHHDVNPTFFLESAGVLVAVSLGAALLVSLLFLLLVKHNATAMVASAVTLQVSIPAAGALGAFQSGNTNTGASLLVAAVALALVFWAWRRQLGLVARLLTLAARALQDNPSVVLFTLLMKLLLMAAATLLGGGVLASVLNGSVLPNPERHGHDACVDTFGQEVDCCVWQPHSWVRAYLPLAAGTLSWTVLLLFEVKVFVVSGVVGQWYFAPVGSSCRGNTLRSLKHATGPSFGSLCLASAVLLVLSRVREATAKLRRRRNCGLVGCLLASTVSLLYTLLEGLTKFATVTMAITGQPFLSAGKSVVSLLARNALDTAGVWWLPQLVLHSCSLLLAAAWGWLVCRTSQLYWGDGEAAQGSALLLGLVSLLLAWLMLSYFCSLLLNIVDAMYICYAMDQDRHLCSKPDVHQVFVLLPGTGSAGAAATGPHQQQQQQQQPGGVAYGTPYQPYAPPRLVPSYYPEVATGYPLHSPPVHGLFMPPPPPDAAGGPAAPSAPPKF